MTSLTQVTAEGELLARHRFAQVVRDYLRDYAQLNTLVEGEESDDRLIWHAIDMVLDDFNSTPPPLRARYAVSNFPNLMLLRDGVVAELLESVALLYARNNLQYQHGGTAVALQQHEFYLQISTNLRGRYEAAKRDKRVSLNTTEAVASSGGYNTTHYHTGANFAVRLLDWSYR